MEIKVSNKDFDNMVKAIEKAEEEAEEEADIKLVLNRLSDGSKSIPVSLEDLV